MKKIIKFNNGKEISENSPCFIIAEAGVNHNGDIKIAKKLVDMAVECKADAVKFQSFFTDEVIIKKAPKAKYHIETTGDDNVQTWYNLIKSTEMDLKMHKDIVKYCKKKKIIFISTPYDFKSVDLLNRLNVEIIKIASTDTNNHPLIKYISKKNKPIILSTAMSNLNEVSESFEIIKKYSKKPVVLMQCTGNYPAPRYDSNLRVINGYKKKFKSLVGYSDHVLGNDAALAAISIGASVYEKHITIDKKLPGPDHRTSMNKNEFKILVNKIRDLEKILGKEKKQVMDSELENRKILRKFIVTKRDLIKGKKISQKDISIKRTGGKGLEPEMFEKILERRTKKIIPKDTPLTLNMLK